MKIDPIKVPLELHSLIPYVERWGFESNEDQDEFAKKMLAKRSDEVREFNSAIDKRRHLITKWGKEIPEVNKQVSDMTQEDWIHPYWSFLNTLKIREITGYEEDDAGVLSAKAKFSQEMRMEQYHKATMDADDAFRDGDYATYISILNPFEDLLSPSQKKKMTLASRKV